MKHKQRIDKDERLIYLNKKISKDSIEHLKDVHIKKRKQVKEMIKSFKQIKNEKRKINEI